MELPARDQADEVEALEEIAGEMGDTRVRAAAAEADDVVEDLALLGERGQAAGFDDGGVADGAGLHQGADRGGVDEDGFGEGCDRHGLSGPGRSQEAEAVAGE